MLTKTDHGVCLKSLVGTPKIMTSFTIGKQVDIPTFKPLSDKWATLRETNVDKLSEKFTTEPNLLITLQDRKFSHSPLVVLRKDILEKMVNLLRDLSAGQVAMHHDVQHLVEAASLVSTLAQEKGILNDSSTSLPGALRILKSSVATLLKLEFWTAASPVSPTGATLTAEECASLPDPEDD